MRILLRADASHSQGVGHVMRILTIAEELRNRSLEPILAVNDSKIDWLEEVMSESGLPRLKVVPASLDRRMIQEIAPVATIIDSYVLPADVVNALKTEVKVTMAIIDGDTLGYECDLFVDPNLGAEATALVSPYRERLLSGAAFTLVRAAILEQREIRLRRSRLELDLRPLRLLCLTGGTDVRHAVETFNAVLEHIRFDFQAVVVSNVKPTNLTRKAIHLRPTKDLHTHFPYVDAAISAAGTTTWELLTCAIPSVFYSVVDNQERTLRSLTDQGLCITLGSLDELHHNPLGTARAIEDFLANKELRVNLAERSLRTFDGQGVKRVVDTLLSRIADP